MRRIGLIGGTGANSVVPRDRVSRFAVSTPWGVTSSPVTQWQSGDIEWLFIARHGEPGRIPPHLVNYRANVWALRQASCERVIGLNAVGGIAADAQPGRLVLADQLIDYTWGRDHTYADGSAESIQHVDFTHPVSVQWHAKLAAAATAAGVDFLARGTYAVTQGPRLETAAEIDRLERDGCTVVGMTAMPEAGLARELELDFAICAVVVNWAAGRSPGAAGIHAEIEANLQLGMSQAERLLAAI